MIYLPAILLGRILRVLVRMVRPGGGSALPGLVVSKLAPGLLASSLRRLPGGVVVITGTAGKSTTTKMVVAIVRQHGYSVFTNPSTANIEQGFYSSILKFGSVTGKLDFDLAILEMDEAHAATVAKRVKPRITAILNVLVDQVDRFVDPANVRAKLSEVAAATTQKVLLNGKDQNCLIIGQELSRNQSQPIGWFGIADEALDAQVKPLKYAPTYLSRFAEPNLETFVTSYRESAISLKAPGCEIDNIELPAKGQHFALDALAAFATASEVLGDKFDSGLAAATLSALPPVFARGEVREINGEPVEFILVQNPPSMQLNLDNLTGEASQIFFAIGRDVHDPSWLYSVDYSNLRKVHTVSGFNGAEAALLFSFVGVEFEKLQVDLLQAIDEFLALPRPTSGRKTVIFSADAMRRIRRHLGFTDPEDVTK
jgi:UDP-N-acetylmuramyl tripeptide synthase